MVKAEFRLPFSVGPIVADLGQAREVPTHDDHQYQKKYYYLLQHLHLRHYYYQLKNQKKLDLGYLA